MKEWVNIKLPTINNEHLGYYNSDSIEARVNTLISRMMIININEDPYNLLLEGYHSATIEGAKTSLEAIKAGRNKKDEKMVSNVSRSMSAVRRLALNEDNIVKVWKMIVDGVCENTSTQGAMYRTGVVTIQSATKVIHVPMESRKIQSCVRSLLDWRYYTDESKIIKSIIMQFYWEYVHPMCDGNGRFGRLLTLWSLYEDNMTKFLYVPVSKKINENLSGYYKSFIYSEKAYYEDGVKKLDMTPFIDYMLRMFSEATHEMDVRSGQKLTELQKLVLRKMSAYGVGVELSVRKCTELFGLTSLQAEIVMDELTRIGYLKKVDGAYKLVITI